MNDKDKKAIKFHEQMIRKACLEVEFWNKEIKFHEDKILRLKNKSDIFTDDDSDLLGSAT